MQLVNSILAFTGFLLSTLVFFVHLPTKNFALLLVAVVCGTTQFILFVGAIVFAIVGAPTPIPPLSTSTNTTVTTVPTIIANTTVLVATQKVKYSSSPGIQGFCEFQGFMVNMLGIATYGVCLCLAMELNRRTSADIVLKTTPENTRWLALKYSFIAVGLPTILITIAVIFRTSPRSIYVGESFCDWSNSKIVFILIYVLALLLYTVLGSGYTVIAVMTYASKRKSIVTTFGGPPATFFGRIFSYIKIYYNRMFRKNRNSFPLNNISSPTAPTPATPATPTPTLDQQSVNLQQILHRMVIWCIGYHLLASLYVIQTVYAVISDLLTQSSTNSNSSDSRASTVLYATAAVSILLFGCFGTGRSALERYRVWMGISKIEKVVREVKRRGSDKGFGGKGESGIRIDISKFVKKGVDGSKNEAIVLKSPVLEAVPRTSIGSTYSQYRQNVMGPPMPPPLLPKSTKRTTNAALVAARRAAVESAAAGVVSQTSSFNSDSSDENKSEEFNLPARPKKNDTRNNLALYRLQTSNFETIAPSYTTKYPPETTKPLKIKHTVIEPNLQKYYVCNHIGFASREGEYCYDAEPLTPMTPWSVTSDSSTKALVAKHRGF
ncbi:hypothetical protein HK098_000476 [Nowakowskiella sp. JEL0407]|nr:hypothetical protein HK098_000476 [Nowakowskiella sp. JEL0407]